LSLAE